MAVMSCPSQEVHHPWAVDSMQTYYVGDLAQSILDTVQAVICDTCQQPLTLLSTAWADPPSVGRGHGETWYLRGDQANKQRQP